jgi:UPF0755 protein
MSELFLGTPAPHQEEPPFPSRRSHQRGKARKVKERRQRRRRTFVVLLMALALVGGAGYVVVSVLGINFSPSSVLGSVTDYPGPGQGETQITVAAGDSGAAIGATLQKAGVVATTSAFTKAFSANPSASSIQPGTYKLFLKMKASDAVTALLSPASRVSFKLTIAEGLNAAQIYDKIYQLTGISVDDLKKAAADPAAIGLPAQANGHVEGWLFPATYQVEPGASAASVLQQMVAQTVKVLTADNVAQDQWLPVLIKASIVEEEGALPDDRAKMARAIQNRLDSGMPLQVDTVIAYGVGKPAMQVDNADRADASNPYNVYIHTGLPPTPIASPGQVSINAVLNPPPGDWKFWVTVNLDTKETRFSATYAQFEQDVAVYKAWQATHPTP